jgi:tetratricopeptide (TPR) repeat protein
VGAASFEEQRKAASASLATQPEATIMSLLKSGLDEGQAMPAVAEVQKWLRNNQPNDPLLLYDAGRAAELSGDWKGAAVLYQQYLEKAQVPSEKADAALYAVYTLLIDRLNDVNSAYAFGRNQGGRLMVCPRAKQFDKWFLETAIQRNDATAVAERLHACIKAGVPSDLLVARYSFALRWLLDSVDGYCERPGSIPVTQELYDAVKALSAAMTFHEEMKLRLDWAVSVKAYNVKKIGDGGQMPGKAMKKQPAKQGNNKQAIGQAREEQKLEIDTESPPPITEATALLAKYPQYSKWVQDGWAGGGNGRHYRNDYKKYWPDQIDAKMVPIVATLPKLTPLQRADLITSWSKGYYDSGPNVADVQAVREYLSSKGVTPEEQHSKKGPVTLEAIPGLLREGTSEAQQRVSDALVKGMTGPEPIWKDLENAIKVDVNRYAPGLFFLADRHGRGDLAQLKQRFPEKFKAHPLEPVLRKALAEGLAQKTVEPWQVLAWINMQNPENNAEQVKLMRELFASPVWTKMPFEVQYAAREWFKKDAMTPSQIDWIDATDPSYVCKDVLALPKEADAAGTTAALSKTIEALKRSPAKMTVRGLERLALVSEEVFTDPKVLEQIGVVLEELRFSCDRASEPFAGRVLAYAANKKDPRFIQRSGAFLWSYGISEHYARSLQATLQLAQAMLEISPAAACAMAKVGQSTFMGTVNEHQRNWFKTGDMALKDLAVKASMKLGLMTISVDASSPAYPIYKSQSEWQGGNEDSAWALCQEHWAQLLPIHRELSMDYLMWVLRRSIYSREDARQEELVKALLFWAAEPNTPLVPHQKAEVEIAYGDIAIQRGMLKQAHELFTRTLQNKAYEGTPARNEAALRRVLVERMSKDFDAALQTLQDLEMERVPEMWSPLRYARAEVLYDMEDYDRAATDIESILAREPDHSEAKIMQGNLQIKRQKLMEATEIELGPVSGQKAFVPGEKLKVTLSDPTLAISGAGTEIEVVVWATSGDKERFFLRQFGDQKTKFRGEVSTALGKPNPDDRILQVLGDDQIYYAYSERFRKKMNNMEEKRGGPISVASDGLLMASARKLLSEAEQRVADMEAQMAALNQNQRMGSASAARAGAEARAAAAAVSESKSGEASDALELRQTEALQKRLLAERIKPGNPLYIRVIDPDRSRTAEKDEVTVSVETSSGDAIGRVVLRETETHSGWFEGAVPTAGAQAKAFAQNSAPGRNPNMVISPLSSYPAWTPVATKNVIPEFSVDLNDNLLLGDLTLTAKEQGSKLKKFIVQTGMNAKEMTTVAVYPTNQISVARPWAPSVTIMNDTDYHHNQNRRSVYELSELVEQIERGWLSQQFAAGISENVAGPSMAMTQEIPAKVKWLRQNHHHNSHVIYRFRGYFYEPNEIQRRFKVVLGPYKVPAQTHPSVADPAQFLLAVDGRPITSKEALDKLEGEIALRPGVHRFEIWATGWDCTIGFGRTVKLFSNLDDSGQWVDCPDSFFDTTTFPKGLLPQRNGIASAKANADGTAFTVAFAPNSRARVLKLICVEQEGPVPVLNKLALKAPDGKPILPVAEDFATLNKNNILEILTGDKVAVRYVDDRFVTKAKEKHERFLDVAFTSAKIDFQFFEMRKGRNGEDEEYYEKLLRFVPGKPVLLTVADADMDISSKPDAVTVTLESKTHGQRQVIAKETGDSTGIFRVWVTPVAGEPKEGEIRIAAGEELAARYRDMENTDPGVPTDRYTSLQQATFAVPELFLSNASVTLIDPAKLPPSYSLNEGFALTLEQLEGLNESAVWERRMVQAKSGGMIRPRWTVNQEIVPASGPSAKDIQAVLGRTLYIEVNAAFLALRAGSQVRVYVQTDAGRKLATRQPGTPVASAPAFDIDVPGTLKLDGELQLSWEPPRESWRETPRIPIYVERVMRQKSQQKTERFYCSVPLIPGVLPEHGVLSDEAFQALQKAHKVSPPAGLITQPNERVHLGFAYTDPSGAEQWLTATVKVLSHPVLDVMEDDYRTARSDAYVGETLALRVVDLGADVSDRSDTVSVLLQAKSGAKQLVELTEVDTHSGVFKGGCLLTYATSVSTGATETVTVALKKEGFPVVYGDTLGARYTASNGLKTEPILLTISKGADGAIAAFSKKYNDPEIAMRTQFTLAESYLEVAKHHRTLKDHELAAREYELAKQLLASAMDQFKDKETRAHAEYLLGNLTLEEADATEDQELKVDRYRAALSRFMNVAGSYADTLHASKAQFKIATIYEKLKEPEVAAQEYVKLAYKYPDSEFLATAMARLGVHFQRMAAGYEEKAKPLLAKKEDKDAQFEGIALQKMSVNEYLKAASIFSRLQERFPDHELAGKGGLYAGQAYMRANQNRQALAAFQRVINNESYDGPEIRAQAMYWAGMCYENVKEPMAAYSLYKRLTFDFPESKWASYARAQLSQEGLLRLESEIEIKRVEEGR